MLGVVNEVIVVDSGSGSRAEPSIRLRVHVLERNWAIEHSSVVGIDGLDELIDPIDGEEGSSEVGVE